MKMTNHESGANLTPSEIAEITRKANLLFPESPQGYFFTPEEFREVAKKIYESGGYHSFDDFYNQLTESK